MRLKSVFRWSPEERLYRLARFIWRRGLGPGVGAPENYDAKLSVAVSPRFGLSFRRGCDEWLVRVGFVRLHHVKSFGGVIV